KTCQYDERDSKRASRTLPIRYYLLPAPIRPCAIDSIGKTHGDLLVTCEGDIPDKDRRNGDEAGTVIVPEGMKECKVFIALHDIDGVDHHIRAVPSKFIDKRMSFHAFSTILIEEEIDHRFPFFKSN